MDKYKLQLISCIVGYYTKEEVFCTSGMGDYLIIMLKVSHIQLAAGMVWYGIYCK